MKKRLHVMLLAACDFLTTEIYTAIEPPPQGTGEILRQERLGGLLKFYRRAA